MLEESTFNFILFVYTAMTNIIFSLVSIKKRRLTLWVVSVTFLSVGALFLVLKDHHYSYASIYQSLEFLSYSMGLIILVVPSIKEFSILYRDNNKFYRQKLYFVLFLLLILSLIIPIFSIVIQLHIVLLITSAIGCYFYILIYIRNETPTDFFIILVIVSVFSTVLLTFLSMIFNSQILWDISYITNLILITFLFATAFVAFPEEKIIESEKKVREAIREVIRERDRAKERSNFAHIMSQNLKKNLRIISKYTKILKNTHEISHIDTILEQIKNMSDSIEIALELAKSGKIIKNIEIMKPQ